MVLATRIEFGELSSAAKDVMMQLFVTGPTWDGNLIAKSGRSELVEHGLAFRLEGFQSLTAEGLSMAISCDVKSWNDQRWYRKQKQLPPY